MKVVKNLLIIALCFVVFITSFPLHVSAATNCPAPAKYSDLAQEYIDFYNIPLKNSKGALNEKFLLNQSNIGSSVIVYGCPSDVDKLVQDEKRDNLVILVGIMKEIYIETGCLKVIQMQPKVWRRIG